MSHFRLGRFTLVTGAVEPGTVVFFEHDPVRPAGIIRETGGRHTVEAVNLG